MADGAWQSGPAGRIAAIGCELTQLGTDRFVRRAKGPKMQQPAASPLVAVLPLALRLLAAGRCRALGRRVAAGLSLGLALMMFRARGNRLGGRRIRGSRARFRAALAAAGQRTIARPVGVGPLLRPPGRLRRSATRRRATRCRETARSSSDLAELGRGQGRAGVGRFVSSDDVVLVRRSSIRRLVGSETSPPSLSSLGTAANGSAMASSSSASAIRSAYSSSVSSRSS